MAALSSRCGHYIFALWLWPPYGIGQAIIFLPCDFYSIFLLLFSSPNLNGRRLDVYIPYFRTWCGLSANFECMSETCCTRLAENTGRKNDAKNRHRGIIAQLCLAISSQLRHVSTIGKNLLNGNMSSMSSEYSELQTING